MLLFPPPPFFLIPSVFFTMPSDIRLNGPSSQFQERYFHRYPPLELDLLILFSILFRQDYTRIFLSNVFYILFYLFIFSRLLTWLLSLSSKDRIGFSSLVHVFIKFATQRWSGGDEIGGGRNVSKRIEKERVLVTKDWFKITRSCETRSLES